MQCMQCQILEWLKLAHGIDILFSTIIQKDLESFQFFISVLFQFFDSTWIVVDVIGQDRSYIMLFMSVKTDNK